MVNGGGGDLIASGDRDVAPKKNRGEKSVWDHNFDIFEVKYGVLLEMVSCFPPHTTLGVGKTPCFGNKIWSTLGDARLEICCSSSILKHYFLDIGDWIGYMMEMR